MKKFRKILTVNDLGANGAHQSGIVVPKAQQELFDILPKLDAGIKNPRALMSCVDDSGNAFSLNFIYYNNKLHDASGTRNEYRITPLTDFYRRNNAKVGDAIELGFDESTSVYRITLVPQQKSERGDDMPSNRIKLKGWHRVH